MNTIVHHLTTTACIALILLTVSCGAKISNKETDASFNPAEMINGGLAILGCTSIVPDHPAPMKLSQELSTDLRQALLKETIDVNVVTWGEVRRAVGDDFMLECLVANDEYGSLGKALVDSLAPVVGPLARYVIVHRLESDVIELSDEDDKEFVDGEWIIKGTKLKTKRTLTGSFSVYDLRTRSRVWSAIIEGNVTKERTITADQDYDIGGWIGKVIDVVIFGDNTVQYPKPASNSQIMNKLYKKFAEELPKKD